MHSTNVKKTNIYIYQSCIYSPTDALVSCLKNIKIYIKIYIKTALTCFGVAVTPSSGSPIIRACDSYIC